MEKSRMKLPIILSLTTLICTGCQLGQNSVAIVENTDTPVEGLNVLQPVALSVEDQKRDVEQVAASQLTMSQVEGKITIGIVNDTYQSKGNVFNQIVSDIDSLDQEIQLLKAEPSSETATSYLESIKELMMNGAEIVIIPSQRSDVALESIVNENIDTIFLTVDQFINAPNVLGVKYRDEGIPYLLGIISAMQSRTKQIGYLGYEGIEFSENVEYLNFLAGAKAVDEDIVVKYKLLSRESDLETITTQAEDMYQNGVDIIFDSLENDSLAVIKVAKKITTKKEPVYVVNKNISQDELEALNNVLLVSSMKNTNGMAHNIIDLYLSNQIRTGHQVILGLENEGIKLLLNNPNLNDETLNLIHNYQEKLIQGEIVISSKTE